VPCSVFPAERGAWRLEALRVPWGGATRSFAWVERYAIGVEGHTVQDRARIRDLVLPRLGRRAWRTGLRVERYSGEGSEFQALKDWTPGLDPRGIDWVASARRRLLTWREHRAERNHPIVLAIDTGRAMRERRDRQSRVDDTSQDLGGRRIAK